MKALRLSPIAALIIWAGMIAISLDSCKKDEKSAVGSADSSKIVPTAQTPVLSQGTGAAALSDKAKKGQLIYFNTSLGKRKMACATCHSDGTPKTAGSQIRQGHTLAGVTSRKATWNGMYKGDNLKKYAYGGALCAFAFEKAGTSAENSLSADDIDVLNEYLASLNDQSGAMKTDLKILWAVKPVFKEDAMPDEKIAKPIVKSIMKLAGDPTSGKSVFDQSCGTCHGMTDKKIGPPMTKAAQDMNNVVQTVRFGSGNMAFYAKDILNDQQVADVIAYIQSAMGK